MMTRIPNPETRCVWMNIALSDDPDIRPSRPLPNSTKMSRISKVLAQGNLMGGDPSNRSAEQYYSGITVYGYDLPV